MKKNIPFTVGILTILSCLTGIGLAGTHTWSGAGANSLWSNAANWSSGGVPTAGEAAPVKLIFPNTAVGFTSTLNISNLKIDAMEFNTSGGNYNFPNAGISTTLTGAAGDNILMSGTSGHVTWLPAVSMQATCRVNIVNPISTIDFQGVIAGNGGMTKTGPGILEFSTGGAANTFTGILRLEAGRLDLSKIAGTPCFGGNVQIAGGSLRVVRNHQIPDSASITLSGGGLSIDTESGFAGTMETIGQVTVSGSASLYVDSPGTLTLGGTIACENTDAAKLNITANPGAQIAFGGATRTFAVPHVSSVIDIKGSIIDGGLSAGINKTGAGKLRLQSANTLSGAFTINGGVLDIWTAGSLGNSSGSTSVAAGATLLLGGGFTLPATEAISLSGTISVRSPTVGEIQGNISLSGSPSFGGDGTGSLKLSGVLSGNPTELIIGSGTTELSGSSSNTHTGVTRFVTGSFPTLILNKSAGTAVNGNINTGGGKVKFMKSNQINDNASIWFETGGTIDLNSQTEIVNSIYSSAGALDPRIELGDGSMTLTGNGDYQLGYITGNQKCIITGSSLATFRKQGSGTMTLVHTSNGSVQNTALYVHNGILNLQGSWKSPIHVVGGLLKGSATTGNVIAAGGDIAFEKFVSTGFTNTGLGGKLIFALNGALPGTGFAAVTVTGAFDLTGIQLQNSLDFLPRADATFTLIDNNGPGPVTGTFNGLPEGSILTIGGQSFRLSYQGGPEGKDVVLYFLGKGFPLPEITTVTKLPNSSVKIDVKGMPGETVVLYNNTNGLSGTWTAFKTIILDASGLGSYIRWNTNIPSEFYRLSYTK